MVRKFENREDQENELLKEIVHLLRMELEISSEANLFLSGGSTPVQLYKKLSNIALPWDKIKVALVDERYVPISNDYSNERMIREALCQNYAKHVSLFGMVYNIEDESDNLTKAKFAYQENVPIPTICLLGMGTDGHTASLFPNDPSSEKNLLSSRGDLLLRSKAPSYPHQRISMSKNYILSAKHRFLMITGEEKLHLLNQNDRSLLPIDHFLDESLVYWAH